MNAAEVRAARRTARYQRARAAFLESNPLCAECRRQGFTAGADELDHIEPVEAGGPFWDESNWQGLCRPCHEAKTAAENARRAAPAGSAAWDAHLEAAYGE